MTSVLVSAAQVALPAGRCRQLQARGLYLADGAETGRGVLWAGEQQLSQAKEGLFLAAVVWVFSTLALPASQHCPTSAG